MAVLEQQQIDMQYWSAVAQDAIESCYIPTLVATRKRLVEAKRSIIGADAAREELYGLIREINQKMAELNEDVAASLLREIKSGFERVQEQLQNKYLRDARWTLWQDPLPNLGRQLAQARPYLMDAIERITQQPISEAIRSFGEMFNAANAKLEQFDQEEMVERDRQAAAEVAAQEQRVRDALAGKVDQKDLIRAKDLLGRFRANIQTGNRGAASSILADLGHGNLWTVLISIFGSVDGYKQFFTDGQKDLQRLWREKQKKTRR